jgi:hypothetical protein
VSRKRGNGEGSIMKRKDDGRWMVRHTVHTATGRKRKTIYGIIRAEVAEKLAKAVMDRADGLVFDAGKSRLSVGTWPPSSGWHLCWSGRKGAIRGLTRRSAGSSTQYCALYSE